MKKTIKKFLSMTIAVAIVIGVMSTATVASASETDSVRVIVRNDVYSVEDGAAWDGVIVDEWVDIDENSSMMSAVVDALDNHGYTQKGAENNYIEEINGLAAFDSSSSSGWMGTLNDWFTNEGFGAFTVASGKLEDDDEICILYTDMFGEDIGGSWNNNETTLKDLSFSSGTLSADFESSVTEYTLTLDSNTTSVMVTPTATNKNYQVRTYKNEYTPEVEDTEYKRNDSIEVADGDKIIIGVGDSNWPSMNQTDGGTVYTINIKKQDAEEKGNIRVIVRNDVYSVEDGAAWDGVLIDEWVDIDENSSMMSAVVDALDNHGYTQSGAENSYIEEINGLASFDSTPSSGWTGTINDWFTNEAYSEFTVASGKLEDGDEICIMYTNTYGEDVGSLWDNNETTLKDLSFSNGKLSSDFESSVTEYTLTLDSNTTSVMVTPTATNKNYQVRTYKNEYTPDVENTEYKRNDSIEVADGDKIIIGVGDSNWPSMNQTDGGTVYTINVKVESEALLGDVNYDNYIDVKDATSIQKFIVGLETFTDEQILNADYNKDGLASVLDATAIQKYIVGIE